MKGTQPEHFLHRSWTKGFISPQIYIGTFVVIFGIFLYVIYYQAHSEQVADIKILVKLLGGEITLKSKLGSGSIFSCIFPLKHDKVVINS